MLYLLMAVPLLFAAVIATRPPEHARWIALVGSFVALGVTLFAMLQFSYAFGGSTQLEAHTPWIPALGVTLDVGVDSVSLLLIALTALLGPICVLASWTAITWQQRTYYAWLLILQTAMVGVFAARDLIFFYVCFEFTLIPMYVLISLFGSTNRKKAATKFFLYTFTGSIVALAGLIYVAWWHARGAGEWTFAIATLGETARQMPLSVQMPVMIAMLLGFAVKVPLFPVHTWLPLAHTEAPTAGSVILAGVLLKLGTYGIYRFVLPFVPEAVAVAAPTIAVLSIIGIVYAGLICWVQTDVKKLVAYSSVSHLGFCVIGLFALNHVGISGSVMYMINHGLSTGALFLLIGMAYERYHTRSMKELGGLAAKMPVWATFMVFFAMASVALPGLNGFVSEFMCMMGVFQADDAWAAAAGSAAQVPGSTPGPLGPWFALAAGTGVIIGAMYVLYMVGKVCFGPLVEPAGHDQHAHGDGHEGDHHLPADLTPREIWTLLPLAAGCLVLGLYPSPVLDTIEPSVSNIVSLYDDRVELPAMMPTGDTDAPADRPAEVMP
ncbi:MAG: NADH-quinone oxidoreductase subunit M [Phycisphaerales bacterium]|nr:MAG: NADH-quinone oxidoreductase subunit M [Phycisphaerales bacterium]